MKQSILPLVPLTSEDPAKILNYDNNTQLWKIWFFKLFRLKKFMIKAMRSCKKLNVTFLNIEVFYNHKRKHSYLRLLSSQDFKDKYFTKTYENIV